MSPLTTAASTACRWHQQAAGQCQGLDSIWWRGHTPFSVTITSSGHRFHRGSPASFAAATGSPQTTRYLKMVCPMCITAAIVANAPGIAAAVGGIAAARVALDKRDRRPVKPYIDTRAVVEDKAISRIVVDRVELPSVTVSCEEY